MNWTAAVITVSDKGYRGEREDTSGPALCARLREDGYEVVYTALVPDERAQIAQAIRTAADERKAALVLTTGGTGFSPRDITPEATAEAVERPTPGLAELMRAESMKITPRGCLSRGIAGIRGGSLIVNLPGSRKAALENLEAVMPALGHGLEILRGVGSADCGEAPAKQSAPSLDGWLREAKTSPEGRQCGMYLFHNGVVRATAKAEARLGEACAPVRGMRFDYDEVKTAAAMENARAMPGIHYVRVWMNRGELTVGDDIMLVLVGGDIRPHVIDALQTLVAELKTNCVTETEQF